MAFDFPSSPSVLQEFTPAGGATYVWNGYAWILKAVSTAPVGAEYITSTTDATLTAERVLTDTATVTWDRTTAGQIKANAAGGGVAVPPQGRLTLQTATPVMTTTQAAKTTIYYTPYRGGLVPIYDNISALIMTSIGAEISTTTTDTTKNPSAIGASKVNDWFVWNDAGTVRLCHGPDWTNDTTRSAGTLLTKIRGILVNVATITNGPLAGVGTYVGTTRSNASSQLDWIYGALAAGGTAGFFGVWNAYNRIMVASASRDSTANWSLTTVATWRAANGSNNMRCSCVRGLDEDATYAQYTSLGTIGSGSIASIGVGLDTTSNFTGTTGTFWNIATAIIPMTATYADLPGLGFHYLQAVELSATSAGVTFQGGAGVSYVQTGLNALFMA